MAAALIDLDRPEAAQTRTELTLTRIAAAWRPRPRGARFVRALVDFLRSLRNPSTARIYSYCILELFEYFERDAGQIPVPDEIRRADAYRYAAWLSEREMGLRRFRLTRDPRRKLDVAIWDIIAAKPACTIGYIRNRLMEAPGNVTVVDTPQGPRRALKADVQWARQGGLGRHLACLVLDHTLVRSPSVEELRRSGVLSVGEEPDEGLFRYYLPSPSSRPGPERSSGIVTRLTALSALWAHLCAAGENAPGEAEPLLRYNVWREPLGRAREVAPSHREARRAVTTPDMDLFLRLLCTTYERSHGVYARQAAELAAYSRPVPGGRGRASYADLRDRALLLIMLQPGGPRAQELQHMRRRDVRGDPRASDPKLRPMLTITGKRGKRRVVPVPPGALDALWQLTDKLRQLAEHQQRYRGVSRAERLLAADAPLLPAIRHWGANAGTPATRPLSRSGLAMALRRRAAKAGIDPGSAELRRVHPHGFRRLFANMAIRGGTPVNVVQAMMGHASGATTLHYAEEREPGRLIAEPFRGVTAAEAPPPPLAAPPRPPPPTAKEVKPRKKAPKLPKPRVPTPADEPMPAPVEVLAEVIEEAPAPERLIAVGRAPERPAGAGEVRYWQDRLKRVLTPSEREQLGKCTAQPSAAEERLCGLYRLAWGERAERKRLGFAEGERAEVGVELAALAVEAEVLGIEPAEVDLTGEERLEQAYAGTDSGLVWWAGPSGKLKPEMPVPSPAQLGRCEPDAESGLCGDLAELWRQWMLAETTDETTPSTPARGPTSACALAGWAAEALASSAAVNAAIVARGGEWLPADAPWAQTAGEDETEDRLLVREHSMQALRAWFERVAWQFRMSPGRVGEGGLGSSARAPKVIGTLPDVPAYYGESDPLHSLSREDRFEVLDFVSALTGNYALQDRSPRFRGASRRELATVIEAMRRYEEEKKSVADLKARRSADEASEAAVSRAEAVAAEAAAEADSVVRAVGGSTDFSIADASAQRIKQRKGARGREYLGDFYLRVVGELFGAEAESDPLLKMVAAKKKPALSRYRELLKPDYQAGTIVHRPRYAEAFAQATGAHSECVARRIARDLWELWLAGKRGSGKLKRRKDLIDLVDAMAAYRVPCPKAQEQELRAWLGQREPVAIYERFREAQERIAEPVERREVEILEEVFAPFEEEFAEARSAELRYLENPLSRPNRYSRAVADRLPNPVEARIAVLTAR